MTLRQGPLLRPGRAGRAGSAELTPGLRGDAHPFTVHPVVTGPIRVTTRVTGTSESRWQGPYRLRSTRAVRWSVAEAARKCHRDSEQVRRSVARRLGPVPGAGRWWVAAARPSRPKGDDYRADQPGGWARRRGLATDGSRQLVRVVPRVANSELTSLPGLCAWRWRMGRTAYAARAARRARAVWRATGHPSRGAGSRCDRLPAGSRCDRLPARCRAAGLRVTAPQCRPECSNPGRSRRRGGGRLRAGGAFDGEGLSRAHAGRAVERDGAESMRKGQGRKGDVMAQCKAGSVASSKGWQRQ